MNGLEILSSFQERENNYMNNIIIKKLKKFVFALFFYHESTDYWWGLRCKALRGGMIGVLAKFFYRILINKYNSFLPLNIGFDGKPVFPHGIRGVFISGGAKIGSNCVIFHQVTIGSNTLKDSKHYGAPIIGDNVYIGCGAKIIGNIKVGNNVRIGANCVVQEDIPDNATVVLPKSRIIAKNNIQDNRFNVF